MSIDDRDLLGDKHRVSSLEARRFKSTDQQKRREAEQLRQRFANFSGSARPLAGPKASWKRFILVVLVLIIGAALLAW